MSGNGLLKYLSDYSLSPPVTVISLSKFSIVKNICVPVKVAFILIV